MVLTELSSATPFPASIVAHYATGRATLERFSSSKMQQTGFQSMLTADSILTVGADGTILWCNQHASKLFGFEAGMLLDRGFAARSGLFHQDGSAIPRFEDFLLRGVFAGEQTGNIEVCLRNERTRNETRWLAVTVDPMIAAGADRAESAITICRDVTESRQMAATLRAREQCFRRLMESNMIGVVFWDKERRITDANRECLRILDSLDGYTEGLRLEELVAPEFRDVADRGFAEILERGVCGVFPCQHLTAAGVRVPVLVSGASLDDGNGLMFVLDISEQMKLEEKLRQTAKLESLGILASGIAHDFNNLLSGILGNATVALEEAAPGSKSAESLRSIVQAGERAAGLAYQMLAYSGRGRFRVEHVDLSGLVSETLTLIQSGFGKATKVNIDMASALPPVKGDPSQLQQIIMNLAINASEASEDKGEIFVRTGTAELDGTRHPNEIVLGGIAPAGDYVFLEVRDGGAGMDPDTLQQIFDPFFTTKSTGRGLGLAAVLGIVRSHAGVISVTSLPGIGTTFTVYLPAQNAEVAAEAAAMRACSSGGIVLVVDDEDYVRETVRRSLETAGYTVVCAADSSQALQLYRSLGSQVELAIVDLTMPGEDGGEVVRRLRHHDPRLKVIATSGYAEADVKAKFGNLMDAFLPKPYRSDRLREVVASTLAG
jgi:PAS domain S-box-containing protein